MSPVSTSSTRLPALDTLRALAIFLVFVYHYRVFVSREQPFGIVADVGWIGVDLFFVLSGYLISAQLLKPRPLGSDFSLSRFYARRALRTWPAFYLILLSYLCFGSALGGKDPAPWWRFVSFTQNIGLQPGTQFSHAWSLCIEEQFYLLLPLIALIGFRFGSRTRELWLWLGLLWTIGIVSRAVLWLQYGLTDVQGYYSYVYYGSVTRFDEFLPGVAVAIVQYRHARLWCWCQRYGQWLFLLGCGAVGLMMLAAKHHYYQVGVGYLPAMTILGFSGIALSFGLVLLGALSPKSIIARVSIPGAASIALWSYSIYLTHKQVGHLIKNQWPALQGMPLLLLVSVCSMAVGLVCYQLAERPFLQLRERFVRSHWRVKLSADTPPASPLQPT